MVALAKPQKSNEWYTPARYIEAAREVLGTIDLDPASCEIANRTVKAARYYTKEENGLRRYQTGEIVQAIALLFGTSLSMPWFTPFWEYPTCIARHRINFDTAEGPQDHFGYGNIFTYLGPHEHKFIEVFSQFGTIAKRVEVSR